MEMTLNEIIEHLNDAYNGIEAYEGELKGRDDFMDDLGEITDRLRKVSSKGK